MDGAPGQVGAGVVFAIVSVVIEPVDVAVPIAVVMLAELVPVSVVAVPVAALVPELFAVAVPVLLD